MQNTHCSIYNVLSRAFEEHAPQRVEQIRVGAEGPAVDDVVQHADEAEQLQNPDRHGEPDAVQKQRHLVGHRADEEEAGELEGEDEYLQVLPPPGGLRDVHRADRRSHCTLHLRAREATLPETANTMVTAWSVASPMSSV